MDKLIRGILDFRKNILPGRRDTFAKLAEGQSPDVLFITCSDSRVAPNWFASTDPGDLFVVRNVGNLVPPVDGSGVSDYSVAAAIEFALNSLKVAEIVICGHSGCGAVHAVAQGIERILSFSLLQWLRFAKIPRKLPPLFFDPNAPLKSEDELSQKNVLLQIENLKTYPLVRERVEKGNLRLHGWWFDIAQASVSAYDAKSQRFVLIDDEMGKKILGRT